MIPLDPAPPVTVGAAEDIGGTEEEVGAKLAICCCLYYTGIIYYFIQRMQNKKLMIALCFAIVVIFGMSVALSRETHTNTEGFAIGGTMYRPVIRNIKETWRHAAKIATDFVYRYGVRSMIY